MNKLAQQPVSYNHALEMVLQHAGHFTPAIETVSLESSINRVLAESVVSDIDLPGADSSSMDGYCLQSADVRGASPDNPVILKCVEGVDAGHHIDSLPTGHCAYIATGAMLPSGADAVIRLEDTRHDEKRQMISFLTDVQPGNFIRKRASEMHCGDIMVGAPALITPPVAGQLASAGLSAVRVYRKPVVAIIASGDEVLMPFESPHPWQVRNSNTTMLRFQAEEAGASVLDFGIARDRGTHARDIFSRAAAVADIIVTSGGISMGRRDPFKQVFSDLSIAPIFYGVRIKPGKPLFFAVHEGKALFALPGNQVSTSVCFELFVRPFIRKVLGAPVERLILDLELTSPSTNDGGRDFFKRGRPVYKHGRLMIEPLESQESHMLTSLAGADLLFLHPADAGPLEAGRRVRCFYLKG